MVQGPPPPTPTPPPYINVPVNAIVRLPHHWEGDSQGQKTFLAPFVDKQIRNYDTECSNHHPSLSTLNSKGLSSSKMKWWAIYTNLPANVIVIFHPWSRDIQGDITILAPSADKQTRILVLKVIFKVLFWQVKQIHRMIPCYGTHGSRQQINRKSIQEEYKIWFFVAGA